MSAVASVARASSWPGLGCPLVELQERNSAFWKEADNSFPSIALASCREKSGEFQIFLSVVKFSIQLPLRVSLRA